MKVNNNKQEWYKEWFNSPYYHILYKNRDYKEAEHFINNIIDFLNPPINSTIVDVACGKGRHSIFIANMGYIVDGFDLSENNIYQAKKNEFSNLKFYVNDIRFPLKTNHYHYAFNLFTSFGYFDDDSENIKALSAIHQSLKSNGVLVLDYMNCKKIIGNLKTTEQKDIEDIIFKISRTYKNGIITKNINIIDNKKEYEYQENVKAIFPENFKDLFKNSGYQIEALFGDYNLSSFDEENSDRLIIVARKDG